MVYSSYAYVKQRILFLKRKGNTYRQIMAILNDRRYSVTKAGISDFLKLYEGLAGASSECEEKGKASKRTKKS